MGGGRDATITEPVGAAPAPPSPARVLHDRGRQVLAACSSLFHLANAVMPPLVGQKLSLSSHTGGDSCCTRSGCFEGPTGLV